MKRRDFLCVLGGATMALPLAAGADQAKVHVIGVLTLGNPDPTIFLGGIREELARLGYIDGRNCRFEERSAQGKAEQLPALASELIRLRVDVLVTWQTPPTFAARDASKEVPIGAFHLASGQRFVERVEKIRHFSVRGFVEHGVLPCADGRAALFSRSSELKPSADESDELARCHSVFQDRPKF